MIVINRYTVHKRKMSWEKKKKTKKVGPYVVNAPSFQLRLRRTGRLSRISLKKWRCVIGERLLFVIANGRFFFQSMGILAG
jgi:hypothetical protein